MANYLAQFQAIKNTSDRLVVAVEDVSDLWPSVKEGLEKRLPLKKASLNNKTRNPVYVENLQAEFILTTDSRLRSRFPQEQYLFWFREPYATIVLVSCEDLDEFKTILKPRLKLIVQNEEREWFIVFVSKAHPNNDQATKNAKKVYARLEVDFNTRKRERCCKLDLNGVDASFWEDFDFKIVESIRNTLDRRVQFYEEEIRKMSEQRLMPVWNFCNFFILKESLAFMFEMAHLHEDSLREYDELELCYIETVSTPGKQRDFGGLEHGDDQAALLKPGFKPLSQIVQDDSFREFEFRQYLFARQVKRLFSNCPLMIDREELKKDSIFASCLLEGQVIETADTTNILIRALQINNLKNVTIKSSTDGCISKRSFQTSEGRVSPKKMKNTSVSTTSHQGSSSTEFSERTLQTMTVERLRTLLKDRGFSPKGRKDELIARLKGSDEP
ncbi:trafficking protein particle complex II-specific subunit 130 homolog [Zingiber officinale]|uniref:trafficking protein particle complex II-specific subunit 130 homolog n=1 Tax=Zingiber officinale TaxID=94328 RepID=UPI001C4BDCF5|nr:trafficking protein particle complex II-specific subunit 130 homolog [Zingiber officinale]